MAPLLNLSKKMYIFFYFLLLTSTSGTGTTTTTTVAAAHDRRALHQPFFPQDSPIIPPVQPPAQPPAQPPTTLPPSSPSSNIPFLFTPTPTTPTPTTTTPPNDQPFFQSFPAPPPPPPSSPSSSSSASFPANISSLSLPTSPKPKRVSSKLIPIAITLGIAAIVVLSIVVFLRIQKRRWYHEDSQSFSDEKARRVVFGGGGGSAAGNGGGGGVSGGGSNSYNRIPKLNRPSQTSSEFLYLGTLVNSHGGMEPTTTNTNTTTGGRDNGESSLQKVGSPELRPLPPLSGGRSHTFLHGGLENSEVESKDEEFEEFYSPKASDGGGSGSRPPFTAAGATGNYNPRRSIGSGSSSYSSSSSGSPARSISLSISPPVSLSPRKSRLKSPELVAIQTAPPPCRPAPPPPPPPPPFHPLLIPSPDVGLSKNSLESSPRLSNSSNDQNSPPAKTPPPIPPPATHLEIPSPKLKPLLNPPVLIKPSRSVPVIGHQPPSFPFETLPENQENLETNQKTPKPKLKPLHWDKVRASSDREMVWDHLKSSSFKLNEEMIETLFVVKPPNAKDSTEKSTIKRPILPSPISHENQVLDPKKSQNIAIALRALTVTIEDVRDALLEGNADTLGTELLESLLKMAPTKEEERKLNDHRDDSPVKLGPAEKFLKALLDVPFAFKRIGAMLYVSNFDSEVEYLKQSFHTLEAACEELKNNRMFLKLLEAVLKTGNRMNVGTNRGDAQAFKLDTLLKLIDIKGADGKTTLLHFVVHEIIRTEGARLTTNHQTAKPGLQVVSSLSSDLSNVKKAAAMDSEVLNGDVTRLSNGIANIAEVVRLIDGSKKTKFSDSMNEFLETAKMEVVGLQEQERVSVSLVREITEYFHGNSAKEEAHPLRIFMVVRDFLTVLDRVCKEVGGINDRITVSSGNKFPVNSMPVFDGFHGRRQYSSSDDDESSCSL